MLQQPFLSRFLGAACGSCWTCCVPWCVSSFPCPRSVTHMGAQVTSCFQTGMLHLWNLSSRWFLMSCYCLISRGWHGRSHPRCPWSAPRLCLQHSRINWALELSLEVIWRWAAMAGVLLGWGSRGSEAEQSSSGVTSSLPHQAKHRTWHCLGCSPWNEGRVFVVSEMVWDLWVKSCWQELPELTGQNCLDCKAKKKSMSLINPIEFLTVEFLIVYYFFRNIFWKQCQVFINVTCSQFSWTGLNF